MEWLTLFEKLIWFGCAAIGFAVLFNVPTRTLPVIALMAVISGAARTVVLNQGANIILASFTGAAITGFVSIWAAHTKHSPPFVFAIPAVIPMVPGVFAYRMMLGLMKLAGDIEPNGYSLLLNETINNGLKTLFVLMALALGVSVPMLIMRRETIKDFPFAHSPKEKRKAK